MEIRRKPIEGYEEVYRCTDPRTGLLAYIAVHDTTLGPALGGCRMWHYSREEDALTDVLPALGISISEAARQLRTSRQSLHAILACERAITPEMALRLGKFCGNGPGLWLRMQQHYDLWHAERRLAALKRWRAARAAELSIDPGVLCPNSALEAIAWRAPSQIDDLCDTPELKNWFVKEFGAEVIEVSGAADPSKAGS